MPVGGGIGQAVTPGFDLRQTADWRGIASAERCGQKSMFWPELSSRRSDRSRSLRLICNARQQPFGLLLRDPSGDIGLVPMPQKATVLCSESQTSCPFLPQTFRLEHRSAPPNWPPTQRPSIGPAPAAGCPAPGIAASATAVRSACFIHSGKLRPVRFYGTGAGGAPLSNPSPNAPAGAEISRPLNRVGNYLQNAEAGVFRHERYCCRML